MCVIDLTALDNFLAEGCVEADEGEVVFEDGDGHVLLTDGEGHALEMDGVVVFPGSSKSVSKNNLLIFDFDNLLMT